MLYTIENLKTSVVEPKEPWSIWREFEVPEFESPIKFKKWAAKAETKYLAYSTFAGLDPTVRVNANNKATRMVGVVADWDIEFTDEEFKSFMKRAVDQEYPMQWVSRSYSGGIHAVWFFEAPALSHSTEGTKRFLKKVAKELGLDKLGPSWDEAAFYDPHKYYLLGSDWEKVGIKSIPSSHIHLWQYETSHASDFKKQTSEIPLETVRAEIEKQFPGDWEGPFKEKSRGRRFWDPSSTNDSSAVVFPQGMRCFTGPAPFVPWSEILGPGFVKKFEVGRIGQAIEKYWYDGKNYFVRLDNGEHFMALKDEVRLDLRARHGLSAKVGKGENLSEVEKALFTIHNEKRVSAALPFAMIKEHIVDYDGEKYFNTSNIRPLKPANGEQKWGENFPIIADWLDTIFGEEQLKYELAWLHYGYKGAIDGRPEKGHAHFLVGEPNCGKTLYNTTILAGLFGGHIKASEYLVGKADNFNEHLFTKFLWTVDDEAPTASRAMHTSFTAKIKEHVANNEFLMNGKFKTPGRAKWSGRLSITLNDDPVSLRILPDLDMSVKDKVMIFRMKPFTKFTRCFKDKITKELPYFAKFVHDFSIPDDMLDVRFGVQAYIEDSIKEISEADSQWGPIVELLRMFRDIYFDKNNSAESDWLGTTSDLMLRLAGIERAQVLLRDVNPNKLGWGLRHLLKSGCEWVERGNTKGKNEWVIKKT